MATSNAAIVIGVGVAAVVAGALGYVLSSKKASAAPNPQPPGPGPGPQPPRPTGGAWTRTTQIPAGSRARMSAASADLEQFETSLGLPKGLDGLKTILSMPAVHNAIQTDAYSLWGPDQTLPSDWPTDDPTLPSGYHMEFVNGPALTNVQALPFPLVAWIPSSGGAPPGPGPSSGSYTAVVPPKLSTGGHYRLSMDAVPGIDMRPIFNTLAPQQSNVQVWGPNDARPSDWPPDDHPAPSTTPTVVWSFEFDYGGPPVPLGSVIGYGTRLWVKS